MHVQNVPFLLTGEWIKVLNKHSVQTHTGVSVSYQPGDGVQPFEINDFIENISNYNTSGWQVRLVINPKQTSKF